MSLFFRIIYFVLAFFWIYLNGVVIISLFCFHVNIIVSKSRKTALPKESGQFIMPFSNSYWV